MGLSLLAQLAANLFVDFARGFLIGVGRSLLLGVRRRFVVLVRRGRRLRGGHSWRGFALRGALFVDALSSLALLLLALFPAFLGFHHVLSQFAVHAEEATVVDYKLRFLLF